MDAIEWNDSYSVGVAELDEQHKKLLRIINTMFESDDLSVNSQTITDILTEMVEYASAHFDLWPNANIPILQITFGHTKYFAKK